MIDPPSERMIRVLVVDDQEDILGALRLLLKRAGFFMVPATSPAGAEATLAAKEFDVALLDMNYSRDTTSGAEGLELVTRLHALDPLLPIVVMTAWGSVASAVEAMKRGACDYLEKPWQNERLLATLRVQAELRPIKRAAVRSEAHLARERDRALPPFLCVSAAMVPVRRLMERVAGCDANVLITGEHGTGKDVVARWLHAASTRTGQAFVPLNAGALADGVFESELFGHVKGAFTDARTDRVGAFEMADRGTLFLDEIGTMPLGQQAKLLRLLQNGEFQPVGSSRTRRADVRVIAATNLDISAEVVAGRFRADLLYRLNTIEVRVPPLRERPEDIAVLAAHFLKTRCARYGKPLAGFSRNAMEALLCHRWPGNVRELEHVVERAVVLAEGTHVERQDLSLQPPPAAVTAVEQMTLADAEAFLIRRSIERTGSAAAAAEVLGLSRSALYRRLQHYGITG